MEYKILNMNKKGFYGAGFTIILSIIILCCFWFLNRNCEYETEEILVTDILLLSQGGFISTDRCLIETNIGKLNLKGSNTCGVQIGDTLYKDYDHKKCVINFREGVYRR